MEVRRIKYERTGGFAGLSFRADFQPGDLPDEQAQALLDLLDEIDFDELQVDLPRNQVYPDQFAYTIIVETEEGEHTILVGDNSASDEMRELLRLLDRIARKRH
jgi:hypothetical protein